MASTKAKTQADELLEGIDKLDKSELATRLRRAGQLLKKVDKEQQDRVTAIEERVKAKRKVSPEKLRQVIVNSTEAEWKETVEWLEQWDDLLPIPLQRLLVGGKVLLDPKTREAAA